MDSAVTISLSHSMGQRERLPCVKRRSTTDSAVTISIRHSMGQREHLWCENRSTMDSAVTISLRLSIGLMRALMMCRQEEHHGQCGHYQLVSLKGTKITLNHVQKIGATQTVQSLSA